MPSSCSGWAVTWVRRLRKRTAASLPVTYVLRRRRCHSACAPIPPEPCIAIGARNSSREGVRSRSGSFLGPGGAPETASFLVSSSSLRFPLSCGRDDEGGLRAVWRELVGDGAGIFSSTDVSQTCRFSRASILAGGRGRAAFLPGVGVHLPGVL